MQRNAMLQPEISKAYLQNTVAVKKYYDRNPRLSNQDKNSQNASWLGVVFFMNESQSKLEEMGDASSKNH